MHSFALFLSVFLVADGVSFAQVNWLTDDGSLFDTGSPESDLSVGSLSLDIPSISAALPDSPGIFAPEEDPLNFDDDADSMFLAGTTNNDCGSSADLLRGKLRARGSFCAVNQQPKAGQGDRESQLGGGIIDSGQSNDDTVSQPILDGTPLVDYKSLDRNFGYCPSDFYSTLSIPVCASDDPALTRKSFGALGVYYNLDHAMLGMITSYHFTITLTILH